MSASAQKHNNISHRFDSSSPLSTKSILLLAVEKRRAHCWRREISILPVIVNTIDGISPSRTNIDRNELPDRRKTIAFDKERKKHTHQTNKKKTY